MTITKISTYLPPWQGRKGLRTAGHDEDSVTMAVAAGLGAIESSPPSAVILVTRQPVLLEGGSSAVICAGLGIEETTSVVEQIGGAAALLDAITSAAPGTLVIGVDTNETGAGAGAVLIGTDQAITHVTRIQRSLPTRTRHLDGSVFQDDDARLTRERGIKEAFSRAQLQQKPLLLAGLPFKEGKSFCSSPNMDSSPELPTDGASSPIFALALLSDNNHSGLCGAFDQACLSVARLNGQVEVTRLEPQARPKPDSRLNEGAAIKMALAAYDRAFESKLKLEAGRCNNCGTLAMPARYRCIHCGSENNSTLTPLPRVAEAYTTVTIHIPIPGLVTPYTLVMAQLQGVDIRILVTLTDAAPESVAIGDPGTLVFRRVAMRSGVPDYGYAFSPLLELRTAASEELK